MYEIKCMNGLSSDRPHNRWDYDSIRPGSVGSVGDVVMQVKLKHSAPDLPLRWDGWTYGKNESFLGSNVQDGDSSGFTSGGRNATVLDTNWGYSDGFKTQRGWKFQDLREPDKLVVPQDVATPQYSWKNKQAVNYEAKRTGNKFMPLPGAFELSVGGVPRGQSMNVQEIGNAEETNDDTYYDSQGTRNIGSSQDTAHTRRHGPLGLKVQRKMF